MPPKAKFTKEEIIDAAIDVIECDGIESLTARSLGAKLGCSARPIFTVFDGMDEVTEAVMRRANAIYGGFVNDGLKRSPAFKGAGEAYITFAAQRPRLFRLLFMRESEQKTDGANVLLQIEEHYGEILQSITDGYGVSVDTAKELYLHLWIYSHGIAVLVATGVCAFSGEEISKLLTEVFTALLAKVKSGVKL